jgi:hypothetical protein
MGGAEKLGDLDRYSLDTLRPMTPEDPGAGAVSPGAALLGTPASVQCITKSRSKLSTSSPSSGLVPTTSTPVAPYEAPPAPSTTPSRGKLMVTTASSLTLVVDYAIKGRHGGITGYNTDRRATRTNKV